MVTIREEGIWRSCFHNATISGPIAAWLCQTQRVMWGKKGKRDFLQKAIL